MAFRAKRHMFCSMYSVWFARVGLKRIPVCPHGNFRPPVWKLPISRATSSVAVGICTDGDDVCTDDCVIYTNDGVGRISWPHEWKFLPGRTRFPAGMFPENGCAVPAEQRLKILFSLASALTLAYICLANIGCGSAKSSLKTSFSLASALTFHYIWPEIMNGHL